MALRRTVIGMELNVVIFAGAKFHDFYRQDHEDVTPSCNFLDLKLYAFVSVSLFNFCVWEILGINAKSQKLPPHKNFHV